MLMLEEMGYLELRQDVYDLPTYEDVEKFLCDIEIEAVSYDDLSEVFNKYDYALVDSDSAMAAELDVIDGALYTERADSDAMKKYSMVLVASDKSIKADEGAVDSEEPNEDEPEIDGAETSEGAGTVALDMLLKAMRSGEVRDYLYSNYHGTIINCRDVIATDEE